MLTIGEKIHVMARRSFEGDLRRHFVGRVLRSNESNARLEGYAFVFDTTRNQFVKKPELRTRLVSLTDSGNIINILPESVEIGALEYRDDDGTLMITDGQGFKLDINEFGPRR